MVQTKRLNYFTGQFLDAGDFRTEQDYHLGTRRRQQRLARGPGIIEGLLVAGVVGAQEVTLSPGVAIDEQGREMVVLPPVGGGPLPVQPLPPGLTGFVHVVMSYQESLTDSHSIEGYTGATRVTEEPKLEFQTAGPSGSQIYLAALWLDANGHIEKVNTGVRQLSTLWLGADHTLAGLGRLHINSPEELYILNAKGAIVGREWGGDGNLSVQGNLSVGRGQDDEHPKLTLQGPNSPTGESSHQDIVYQFAAAGSAVVRSYRDTSWGTHLQFSTTSNAAGGDNPQARLHIDPEGKVGIGTSSPSCALEVAGPVMIRGRGNGLSFSPVDGGPPGEAWISWNQRNDSHTTLQIGVSDSALDHIALMPSGSVGIGTDEPKAKLHVAGDTWINGNAVIGVGTSSHLKVRHVDGKHYLNDGPDDLYLNYETGKPVHTGSAAVPSDLSVHGRFHWANDHAANLPASPGGPDGHIQLGDLQIEWATRRITIPATGVQFTTFTFAGLFKTTPAVVASFDQLSANGHLSSVSNETCTIIIAGPIGLAVQYSWIAIGARQ